MLGQEVADEYITRAFNCASFLMDWALENEEERRFHTLLSAPASVNDTSWGYIFNADHSLYLHRFLPHF